ncbi:hypothetical protein TIFTF001_052689 [Ficus carica]|uniref:Uncharacterized protein n=1 Tax=Ficus carica TaxID=3494 RepID=A0AA88JF12_FICCA|nr:hypothetical protein TIFTF001_052689 [Ficus carica]
MDFNKDLNFFGTTQTESLLETTRPTRRTNAVPMPVVTETINGGSRHLAGTVGEEPKGAVEDAVAEEDDILVRVVNLPNHGFLTMTME